MAAPALDFQRFPVRGIFREKIVGPNSRVQKPGGEKDKREGGFVISLGAFLPCPAPYVGGGDAFEQKEISQK